MIRANQIPDEVVEAARAAYRDGFEQLDSHEEIMRASIAAALSAWPGAGRFEDVTGWDVHIELPLLIHLSQEVSDE